MPTRPSFNRILLKVSGEMLGGAAGGGIDIKVLDRFAEQIHRVIEMGIQTSIIIGGGNIFRGVAGAASGMDRAGADSMGMLATVINGLALQDALERRGCDTRLMSAVKMSQMCEPYIRRRALRHMEKGRAVILAGGTGNPYFSTDTAAALRGAEINADVILKATKVDGVYTKDPMKHDDAELIPHLDYMEVLNRGLKVMDSTAISLCMDNQLPIIVFSFNDDDNLTRVVNGEEVGTLVSSAG